MQLEYQDATSLVGDRSLIVGAVLNLVSNAIKYGRSGTNVVVRCENAGATVAISVHNQSEPIPSADLTRVFESYYRARKSEAEHAGWGLGLAFVKRIAEKHGGTVHAESSDVGTTFELRFPSGLEMTIAKGTA